MKVLFCDDNLEMLEKIKMILGLILKEKYLLCLDVILSPLFHIDCSISDSLKSVRKNCLNL